MLKIKHSGGDPIIARVNHCDEISTYCNMIPFYTFNKVPLCEPANALLVARFICTAYKFDVPPKIDTNIKGWISNNNEIPRILLSLIDHYWSDKSAETFEIPQSFSFNKDDVAPNDTDPEIVFSTWFKRDATSFVEITTARKIFEKCGMTDNMLTRMMNDKGLSKDNKRYTSEDISKNPNLKDKRRYVYTGIKQIKSLSDKDEDQI